MNECGASGVCSALIAYFFEKGQGSRSLGIEVLSGHFIDEDGECSLKALFVSEAVGVRR